MLQIIFNILNIKEKRKFFLISVLIIFSSFFELLGVGILYPFFNILFDDNFSNNEYYIKYLSIYELSYEQILIYSLACILLIYIFKNLFVFFVKFQIQIFAKNFRIRIFQDMMSKYLYLPYELVFKKSTENILKRINFSLEFSNTISFLLTLVSELLVLLLIIFFLLKINLKISLTVIIFFLISSLFIYLFTKKKLNFFGEEAHKKYQQLTKEILQSIGGIKEIKLFNKQNFFFEKMSKIQSKDSVLRLKTNLTLQFPSHLIEVACIVFILFIIFALVQNNSDNVEIISILAIYGVALARLMPCSTRILAALQNLKYSYPISKILYEELRDKEKFILYNHKNNLTTTKIKIKFNNKISIKNISYYYDNKKIKVLNNLNLNIKKGECIGIYGKSGSGKSTLSEILIGLLKPRLGKIFVDNISIDKNLKSWQEKIGIVSQNPYFLNDSIKKNITFGLNEKNIDNKKITSVIKETQLYEFIKKLPNKLNTIVGERGISLSGGQLQRIAISRALYLGSQVLLLDEATNSLDKKNEDLIFKLIKKLKKKITIIIISHQKRNFRICDDVYKLINGKLLKDKLH